MSFVDASELSTCRLPEFALALRRSLVGRIAEQFQMNIELELVSETLCDGSATAPATWCSERRAQHAAGRRAAARSLRATTGDAPPIPRGPQGAPLWPNDAIGSISHSAALAVAVTAKRAQVSSVGIDVEPVSSVRRTLPRRVLNDRDRQAQAAIAPHLPTNDGAALVLSAKESIFKCAFQFDARRLAFADISVCPTADGALEFVAEGDCDVFHFMKVLGAFTYVHGHVVTLCVVHTSHHRVAAKA